MDLEKIRRKILDKSIYKDPKYKAWRKKVYKRDRHTCRMCGAIDTYLNAHHIRPKYRNPHLIYTVSNGITLCVPCHKKVTGVEQDYVRYFDELVRKGLDAQKIVKKKSKKKVKKKKVSKKKRVKNLKRLLR